MNSFSSHPAAIARIHGNALAPNLHGYIRFYQAHKSVLVAVDVCGLPLSSPSGFFALHIHDGYRCSNDDFANAGGHYNPSQVDHPRHAGDLPPLLSCHGSAHMIFRTDRFCIPEILHRTVIIHSDPDDFRSQPAGNAGDRIGCGVIFRA